MVPGGRRLDEMILYRSRMERRCSSMRQHLAILCDNKPGVLTHVAGLISRRAINIECINAGYTEEPD